MLTTFYPPHNFGGDGIYVRRLSHALARRGHTVEVIYSADAYRTLSGMPEPEPLAEPPGVTVHRLESRLPGLANLLVHQVGRPVTHAARLARLLTDRFDVIHFHNTSLIGGPGIWSYGSGVKLLTAHEHWLVCPTHLLWRFNRELCDARRCFTCALTYRRPPQLWRHTSLMKRQARHIDGFIMLSRSAADNHRRFGFDAPLLVSPSFLPEEPAPATTATPARPYFLFVGRLEAIKGVEDVLPYFTGIDGPEFLIAGTGDGEGLLRDRAAGLPRVRFLGRLPPEALRSLYRSAIAVITPSRSFEAFPLVVLEAFRDGAPIVARDRGPYPEIIEASDGGLLFRNDDDLRRALDRLTGDAGLRARLGEAGRAAWKRLWSEDAAIAAYFDMISKAAERKNMQNVVRKIGAARTAGTPIQPQPAA